MTTLNKIKIGGVETFSAVDFPGKLAAAVFMQGCPWRCPFCYNTHLQPSDKITNFIWDKFVAFLKQRKGILEAVAFSGGEPLMQEGLLEAILEVKQLGYAIGLHTGGYRPDMLAKVIDHIDWVGFDIKAPFTEAHYAKAVGGANHLKNVLTSFKMVLDSGKDFECRTTCDPRLLQIKDIYTIAEALKAQGVKNYHLQKYRPIPGDDTPDYECEKFLKDQELISYLRENFAKVELRG